MKKFLSVAVLALGLFSAGGAEARVAVGGGIGVAQFDYPDVDDGSARILHIAIEGDENPFYFEFALINSGDADISGFTSLNMNVSGNQIGGGYRIVTNSATGSGFYLKGGIYNTDTEVSDPDGEICGVPCSIKDGNNGLYIGIGGELMLNPSFGFRFDLQGLLGVEDFAEDKTVTFMTVGPVLKFGAAD
jgi:hypothetical protein